MGSYGCVSVSVETISGLKVILGGLSLGRGIPFPRCRLIQLSSPEGPLVSRDEAESKPGSEFAKAYPNQVIAARLVQRYDAVAQAREPELDHVTLSATEPRGALPLQEWSLVAIPDKGEAMRGQTAIGFRACCVFAWALALPA